jgi:hypothetical protein
VAARAQTLIVLLLSVWAFFFSHPSYSAGISSYKLKTLARQKAQCDNEGIGRACYDYGRSMWSTRGIMDRKQAKIYFARGCELKYTLACQVLEDHSTISHSARQSDAGAGRKICFTAKELDTARFNPFPISPAGVMGQKISQIQASSFWARAGVEEDDVLIKVNNLPLNSMTEMRKAFGSAGKSFGFEIRRGEDIMTKFYNCQ